MHTMTKVERKEFADTTRVYIVERNSQASEKFQVTTEKTHLETLLVTMSFFLLTSTSKISRAHQVKNCFPTYSRHVYSNLDT